MTGSDAPALMQEATLVLCGQLKDDAVSLVDAIAPPDFVLNSPIGLSDGQVGSIQIFYTKASTLLPRIFYI